MCPQDLAILSKHFQFIRNDEQDIQAGEKDWQVRMSVRYYQQLFREFALADLSRYEEGKIGLRWRTEREVVTGKGQFTCGNKACEEQADLRSYELMFTYKEEREKKRCLVKVRACPTCAPKLFYKQLKEKKRHEKRGKKRRRGQDRSSSVPRAREGIHALCAQINADQKAAALNCKT